jgi:hypothetical protein
MGVGSVSQSYLFFYTSAEKLGTTIVSPAKKKQNFGRQHAPPLPVYAPLLAPLSLPPSGATAGGRAEEGRVRPTT